MVLIGADMTSVSSRKPASVRGTATRVHRVLALVFLAAAAGGFLPGCATPEDEPVVLPRVGHSPLGAPSCFLLDGDIKMVRQDYRGALESYLDAIMTSSSTWIRSLFYHRWRHDKVATALEVIAWDDTTKDDTLKALVLIALDNTKEASRLLQHRLMNESAPTSRFRLLVLLDKCAASESLIATPIGELDEQATAVDRCKMLIRRWGRSKDLNEKLALSKELVEKFGWCETSYSLRRSSLWRAGRSGELARISEERIRKCGLTNLAFYELITDLRAPTTREDAAWAVARELAVRFPYYDMTSLDFPLLLGEGPPKPRGDGRPSLHGDLESK